MDSDIAISRRSGKLIDAVAHAVYAAPPDDPQLRTVERVAGVLQGFLHHPDLLTAAQQEPDPRGYRQHALYVDPAARFSLVALVWLPGQHTPVHDHTTWCAAGTYRGCEQETSYRTVDGALEPIATTANPVGTVTALAPPGDIHLVRNAGTELAISLHVYGTDVIKFGGSIRRCYETPGSTA